MKKLFAAATGYARLARLLALCCLSNAALAALPSGGQIVAGSGQFSQSGTHLSIVQESQFMVTEWANFSIGAGETVSILQPSADSALLIRVMSEAQAEIAGKLQSNGRVVIANDVDIIASTSVNLDMGGFLLDTRPISNQDFMAGQLPANETWHGCSPTGSEAGACSFTVAWGTLTVSGSGNLTVNEGMALAGGTISGTGNLNLAVNGGMAWTGGTINSTGNLTVNGGTILTLSGTGSKYLQDKTWTDTGTLHLTSGAGTFTATTFPASGNIGIAASAGSLTAPTWSTVPGGTVTLYQLPDSQSGTGTIAPVSWGTISQQVVSAANTYVVNTAGAVFGTSAIVATTGLATPEGAPVELAGLSVSPNMQVSAGWNLLGNSTDAPLDVATAFGDAGHINSVWKWLPTTSRWAFYTPSLSAQELADYAASKGYDILASIAGGEGFWVNAQAPFVFALPFGSLLPAATVQTSLTPGWNLVSVGEDKTPGQFGAALGLSQAADATVWAWDKTQAKWYFHAPSLEAQGGTALADYIAGKGYLDFGAAAKSLGAGMGFWVRKP